MRKYILYTLVLALIFTMGFTTKAAATSKIIYYNHGVAYMQQGKYKLAIKDFTQVIRLDPKNAKAYFFRGLPIENWVSINGLLMIITRP